MTSDPAPRAGHRHATSAGAVGSAEAGRPPSWLREAALRSPLRAAGGGPGRAPPTVPGREGRHRPGALAGGGDPADGGARTPLLRRPAAAAAACEGRRTGQGKPLPTGQAGSGRAPDGGAGG